MIVNKNKIKNIDGLLIEIPPTIYDPAEDSFLLTESSQINSNEKVLEIGSGSGYISIYLAKNNPTAEFFSLDINPIAARTTKINSNNNSTKIHVITGDLFEALIPKPFFDVVLFNSPYLPVHDKSQESIAWTGGQDGLEIVIQFIKQLVFILKKTGRAYLVVSSYTNNEKLFDVLKQNHFSFKLIDQVKEGRERILLYRISFENR
ncbi:MAG: methyltransferase [Asgard group archaeon]|nr:methyltransferase [Asgard group archaeon]